MTMSCAWQVAQAKPLKMTDRCKMQNEAIWFLSFESVDMRRFRKRPILAGFCFEMLLESAMVLLRAMGSSSNRRICELKIA